MRVWHYLRTSTCVNNDFQKQLGDLPLYMPDIASGQKAAASIEAESPQSFPDDLD